MTIRPTVAEIVAELDHPTAEIGWCRHVRHGQFQSWVKPSEIWIEAFSTWLRADGSYASDASFTHRGSHTYGRDSRRELRRAVERWADRRAHGPSQREIMQTLNRLAQPKDWDGTFNGAIAVALIALLDMKPEIPR